MGTLNPPACQPRHSRLSTWRSAGGQCHRSASAGFIPTAGCVLRNEFRLLNFGTRFRLGTAAGDRGGSSVSTCAPVAPPATELPAPVQWRRQLSAKMERFWFSVLCIWFRSFPKLSTQSHFAPAKVRSSAEARVRQCRAGTGGQSRTELRGAG